MIEHFYLYMYTEQYFYPFKFVNEITSQLFRCRTFLVIKTTLIATAVGCYFTIFIVGGGHRVVPKVVHMHTITFMSLFQACLFEPNPTFCLNVLNTCPPFDLRGQREVLHVEILELGQIVVAELKT